MKVFLSAIAAVLGLSTALAVHADGYMNVECRQNPCPVNPGVPLEPGFPQYQEPGYGYAAPMPNIPLYNPNYQFNGAPNFFAPGYGMPANFQCSACSVFVNYNWAEVIAYSGFGGGYRIWGGPANVVISAVNAIKMQTGMCQNLPFLQPPMPYPGPWGPMPGWGPVPAPY